MRITLCNICGEPSKHYATIRPFNTDDHELTPDEQKQRTWWLCGTCRTILIEFVAAQREARKPASAEAQPKQERREAPGVPVSAGAIRRDPRLQYGPYDDDPELAPSAIRVGAGGGHGHAIQPPAPPGHVRNDTQLRDDDGDSVHPPIGAAGHRPANTQPAAPTIAGKRLPERGSRGFFPLRGVLGRPLGAAPGTFSMSGQTGAPGRATYTTRLSAYVRSAGMDAWPVPASFVPTCHR